jgi:hypothetical protein
MPRLVVDGRSPHNCRVTASMGMEGVLWLLEWADGGRHDDDVSALWAFGGGSTLGMSGRERKRNDVTRNWAGRVKRESVPKYMG